MKCSSIKKYNKLLKSVEKQLIKLDKLEIAGAYFPFVRWASFCHRHYLCQWIFKAGAKRQWIKWAINNRDIFPLLIRILSKRNWWDGLIYECKTYTFEARNTKLGLKSVSKNFQPREVKEIQILYKNMFVS